MQRCRQRTLQGTGCIPIVEYDSLQHGIAQHGKPLVGFRSTEAACIQSLHQEQTVRERVTEYVVDKVDCISWVETESHVRNAALFEN